MLRRLLSFVLVLSLMFVELPYFLQMDASAAEVFSDSEVMDVVIDEVNTVEEDMYAGVTTQSSYPVLKRGDRDGDDSTANIVILQNRLIALEYLYDSADGVYGD